MRPRSEGERFDQGPFSKAFRAALTSRPMSPEGNAALEEALLDLPLGRFESGGANDGHPELAIHPADARQNTLTHFADESDGESASFALSRDAMFGEARRTQFAGQ